MTAVNFWPTLEGKVNARFEPTVDMKEVRDAVVEALPSGGNQ